jgi:hypothetical protein
VPRRLDRAPGAPYGERRLSGQPGGQAGRGRVQVLVADHPVGQPDPQGLLGVDDLAEQDQLPRAALPDDPGQPDGGAHVGEQTVAGLNQPHLGALGKDTEVAGQGQLKSGAVSVAAHGGDAGTAEVRDPAEGPRRGEAGREAVLVQRPVAPPGQQSADPLN